MEAVRSAPAVHGSSRSQRRSSARRLRQPATDERLVARVRSGSDSAFAELYDRHYRGILAFCRHMLGSREEAEDAVQQTFISAYRDMRRHDNGLRVRPWLYQIARNDCIDALRSRRPGVELSDDEPSRESLTAGLPDEVAEKGELQALLADLARLPLEQREALVLVELHGSSHREVASILGCDAGKVKSLVFQGRQRLIKGREARELSCREVREQLSVLRGSALRRGAIGQHVRACEGCRTFEHEVRMQRRQLAILLVVTPSAALQLGAGKAMAAVGAEAGKAAGSGASGAGGGTSATATGGAAAGSAGAGVGGASGMMMRVVGSVVAVAGKVGLSATVVKGVAATAAVAALGVGGVAGAQRLAAATGSTGSTEAGHQAPVSGQDGQEGQEAAAAPSQTPAAPGDGNAASPQQDGEADAAPGARDGSDARDGTGTGTGDTTSVPDAVTGPDAPDTPAAAGTTGGGGNANGSPAAGDAPGTQDEPRSRDPKARKGIGRGHGGGPAPKQPHWKPKPAPKPQPEPNPPRPPAAESPAANEGAKPEPDKPLKAPKDAPKPEPPGHAKLPKLG
jgi:RNA polymerase sigma factor (sigma-70 family)